MQVSVIIPVYNASLFLEEAVRSALTQPEVTEVLLIEDGSHDASLSVCERLTRSDMRVKLFRHPDLQNHGAGASRNLGIAKATSTYLAFLDADDIYLPGRFAVTRGVFNQHIEADGVYETIGTIYSHDTLKGRHLDRTGHENTGLAIAVPPESLFRELATGRHGHLHLNGLTIRKSTLDESLLFDISLRQCQDSDWILRMASKRKLYAGTSGRLVSMRRVHEHNRVLNTPEAMRFQRAFLRKSIHSGFYGSKDRFANSYLVARYVSWLWHGSLRKLGFISRPVIICVTGLYLIAHPGLLYRLLFK